MQLIQNFQTKNLQKSLFMPNKKLLNMQNAINEGHIDRDGAPILGAKKWGGDAGSIVVSANLVANQKKTYFDP